MIGVSITVTLRGKEEEQKFLELFTKAAGHADKLPGLVDLQACKVLGRDFAYHLFTLWDSEEAIEAWLADPRYREIRKKGADELIASFVSYRWKPLRPPLRRP